MRGSWRFILIMGGGVKIQKIIEDRLVLVKRLV